MNTIATNLQMPEKPAAAVRLPDGTEGASARFGFAQTRKEKPPGPGHYLILVRRHHADRAKLSRTFRSITN